MLTPVTCYDMANAFPSITTESLNKSISTVKPTRIKRLINKHFTGPKCILEGPDGGMVFASGAGVFPGSSIGNKLFNQAFAADVVSKWDAKCVYLDANFTVDSIVIGFPVNASSTVFVDDIARRHAAATFTELVRLNRTTDKYLSEVCSLAGLGLNREKMEVVVSCWSGPGSVTTARSIANTMRIHGTTALGRCRKTKHMSLWPSPGRFVHLRRREAEETQGGGHCF